MAQVSTPAFTKWVLKRDSREVLKRDSRVSTPFYKKYCCLLGAFTKESYQDTVTHDKAKYIILPQASPEVAAE